MNTPRTAAVLGELLDDKGEIYEGNCPEKLVKLSRQLEAELAAMTDKVSEMELYKKAYQETARKCDMACSELSAVNKSLKAEREKVATLLDAAEIGLCYAQESLCSYDAALGRTTVSMESDIATIQKALEAAK